jgi:hypothetical protein
MCDTAGLPRLQADFPGSLSARLHCVANTSSSRLFMAWNARLATNGLYSLRPDTLA